MPKIFTIYEPLTQSESTLLKRTLSSAWLFISTLMSCFFGFIIAHVSFREQGGNVFVEDLNLPGCLMVLLVGGAVLLAIFLTFLAIKFDMDRIDWLFIIFFMSLGIYIVGFFFTVMFSNGSAKLLTIFAVFPPAIQAIYVYKVEQKESLKSE
ncbi:hypothetical protein H0194_04620 [Corynebacterium incognita]|uniref:Uncharacterized protein n=1 Tax=Corynebacterium incognita TaxID=2754725 RepID=A0A7G7CRQ1_9CORY|nr:hypothetical protein [Corynebacterium incognita]QNE90267.1 hypothetical protein H0194_04620 [Corynebacterium incognita]